MYVHVLVSFWYFISGLEVFQREPYADGSKGEYNGTMEIWTPTKLHGLNKSVEKHTIFGKKQGKNLRKGHSRMPDILLLLNLGQGL